MKRGRDHLKTVTFNLKQNCWPNTARSLAPRAPVYIPHVGQPLILDIWERGGQERGSDRAKFSLQRAEGLRVGRFHTAECAQCRSQLPRFPNSLGGTALRAWILRPEGRCLNPSSNTAIGHVSYPFGASASLPLKWG